MPNTKKSQKLKRGGKREGAGRKRKYETPTVRDTYGLPEHLHAWIASQADAAGLSKSAWLAGVLEGMRSR